MAELTISSSTNRHCYTTLPDATRCSDGWAGDGCQVRHGWADGDYRDAFLDWAYQRRGIAFQAMSRSDGGRRRWLPPGATPPIVSAFAVVPRRGWWSGPLPGWADTAA